MQFGLQPFDFKLHGFGNTEKPDGAAHWTLPLQIKFLFPKSQEPLFSIEAAVRPMAWERLVLQLPGRRRLAREWQLPGAIRTWKKKHLGVLPR
jgi:hypothetical protein